MTVGARKEEILLTTTLGLEDLAFLLNTARAYQFFRTTDTHSSVLTGIYSTSPIFQQG
jgi:hypothetical protein